MSAQNEVGEAAEERPGFAVQLQEDLPPADVRHVLLVFRADLQRLTETLDRTITAFDAEGFRRTAHALAGAAGAVGAVALEDACRAAMLAVADPGADGLAACNDAIQAQAVLAAETVTVVLAKLDAAHG